MEYLRERQELACALRWCARLGMHEAVANHFSLAVDAQHFLINPGGMHFSRICASDLLLLNANAAPAEGADPTAWCLHGTLHRRLPFARCLLHTHAPYATALASLEAWRLQAIDQNACRFFNRVSYDEEFGGMLLAEEEAARQAAALGGNKVLVMRSHGVLVVGESVADAFDTLYYFERTCHNQWLAMATGQPLRLINDDIAEKTAQQWETYPNAAHFAALQAILREEEPDAFR